MPIKIINKNSSNPIIAFGSEDDGHIQFERDYFGEEPSGYRFSVAPVGLILSLSIFKRLSVG